MSASLNLTQNQLSWQSVAAFSWVQVFQGPYIRSELRGNSHRHASDAASQALELQLFISRGERASASSQILGVKGSRLFQDARRGLGMPSLQRDWLEILHAQASLFRWAVDAWQLKTTQMVPKALPSVDTRTVENVVSRRTPYTSEG